MNTSIIESGLLSSFCNAKSEQELEYTLDRSIKGLGFSQYGYVSLKPNGENQDCYIFTNNDQEWVDRYVEKGYVADDHIFTMIEKATKPFFWGQEVLPDNLTKMQKNIFFEASDFSISKGVTIPLRGPGGEFTHFTASYDGSLSEMKKLIKEIKREFYLLGISFHSSLSHLNSNKKGAEVQLSPFEISLLEHLAEGKSIWDISKKIGVSSAKIDAQIWNICKKMGTNSRMHAMAKAFNLGILRQ